MSDALFDKKAADRWFAVEFNNQAWDLVEKTERSEEETDRMLHVAHAAWVHWQSAGNSLNQQRAECLLATAYLAAGNADAAVRFGRSCVKLASSQDCEPTSFDLACAHGCLARGLLIAGKVDEAAEQYSKAESMAQKLADESDREAFVALYPPV